MLAEVDGVDSEGGREREPLGHEVDAEDAPGASVQGEASGHLPDRSESVNARIPPPSR
jgi:hypothetical protein